MTGDQFIQLRSGKVDFYRAQVSRPNRFLSLSFEPVSVTEPLGGDAH